MKSLRKNGLVSQLRQDFVTEVVSGGSLDVAEVDFLTLSATNLLNRERVLSIRNGLTFTDTGANGSYHVDIGTPTSVSASTVDEVTTSSHTHAVIASPDPGASASLLETTAAGLLTLESLYSGGGAFQADNFVSQLTGWQISYAGNADFRSVYADEMHVKAFIADIEQALAGGQIIPTSVSTLSRDMVLVPPARKIVSASAASDWIAISGDFTDVIDNLNLQNFDIDESTGNDGLWAIDHTEYVAPDTRVFVTGDLPSGVGDGTARFRCYFWVDDLPGFEDFQVFTAGDWVRLRVIDRSGGGLVVADAWGQVYSYTDLSGGEQRWQFRARDDGGVAGSRVYEGAIALDYGASGDGYWEVTATGSILGDTDVPYSQIVTWANDPSDGDNHTLHMRLGNLDGVTDGSFPTVGGWGLYSDNAFLSGVLEVLDDSFFAGIVTIGTSGELRQGTGTLGSNYTGLRIWNDTSVGRIGGYNNDTLQWYADTDGKLYGGGGVVRLDDDGISIDSATSYDPGSAQEITFYEDSAFTDIIGAIDARSQPGSGTSDYTSVKVYVNDQVNLTTETASIVLQAAGSLLHGADTGQIQMSADLVYIDDQLRVDGVSKFVDDLMVGSINPPSYRLDVRDNVADYVVYVKNDGNAATRDGILMDLGEDANPSAEYIRFRDGDGNVVGRIFGDGAGSVTYGTSSDERIKQDIEPLGASLDKVLALEPITYRGRGAPQSRAKRSGLIAQQVQGVIPDVVSDRDDLLSLDYAGLVPYLIGAIQELEQRIRTLEA